MSRPRSLCARKSTWAASRGHLPSRVRAGMPFPVKQLRLSGASRLFVAPATPAPARDGFLWNLWMAFLSMMLCPTSAMTINAACLGGLLLSFGPFNSLDFPARSMASAALVLTTRETSSMVPLTTSRCGPFQTYSDMVRSILSERLLDSDRSHLLDGWRQGGLRPRLEAFLSNDVDHILASVPLLLRGFPSSLPPTSNTVQWDLAAIWDAQLEEHGVTRARTIDGIEKMSWLYSFGDGLCPRSPFR